MLMTIPYLSILIYSFTLWFGLYLIARDYKKAGLRYAGLGLVSYAVALAFSLLLPDTPQTVVWRYLSLLLPSLFWMAATLYLVPDIPIKPINTHLILVMIVLFILTIGAALTYPDFARYSGLGIPIIFLLGVIIRLRQVIQSDLPRSPLVIFITATIFFALATGLIIIPIAWLSEEWVVILISLDLICLGYTVGVLDAYDEGTTLFVDALRSLAAATLAVLIFGGQVVMVMVITGETSSSMLGLLLGLIASLLIALVFYDQIQSLLDDLILTQTDVRQQRAQLRAASSGITRATEMTTNPAIDEQDFVRWTRRALSHYGDLNKLAASPLLQLPLLDEHHPDDNVLARANALKSLLRDSVEQLKPSEQVDFAPSDEWRYYNVLYYPYIVGLKPYSARFYRDDLAPAESAALTWFRTYVPERTLYNWQKTAAELVANDLREKVFN